MARGTRLFQATGSPLIQGSSKHERPTWQGWLAGSAVALALAAVAEAGLVLTGGPYPSDDVPALAGYVVAAFAGSLIGVTVARSWGARRLWVAGAMAGVATGALTYAALRVAGF